ncbi:zinc-ribbon domain-containing protein [Klenkia soli]|uniref:zinc-ribbon domain-containing protein n=1 Tax=Klenkia soli TaxID=1052260 RepID=UPI003BF97159
MAPDVARHWDEERNGGVKPTRIHANSRRVASWMCPDCGTRGQDVMVLSRVAGFRRYGPGHGCRRCSLDRRDAPKSGMSLADKRPELVPEFDLGANHPLTPTAVPATSNKKCWWHCPAGLDHPSYPASPANRRRSGCPACAGKMVTPATCLATRFPLVAESWHPTLNHPLTPHDVTCGTPRIVWWRCRRGHDWRTSVALRTGQSTQCPRCHHAHRSNIETRIFSELFVLLEPYLGAVAIQHNLSLERCSRALGEVDILISLHRSAGPVVETSVARELQLIVEFDGAYWHRGRGAQDRKKSAAIRAAGYRLIRVREQPLRALHPDDVAVVNGGTAHQAAVEVLRRLRERAWLPADLILPVDEYLSGQTPVGDSVANALLADGSRRNLGSRSLAMTHPHLAAEWDGKANGDLTAWNVTASTSRSAWWICERGDRFSRPPRERAAGGGCQYCSGRAVNARNCLLTTHADLSAELMRPEDVAGLHGELSGALQRNPADISGGYSKIQWWCCSACDFQWLATVKNRARNGSGCPRCWSIRRRGATRR